MSVRSRLSATRCSTGRRARALRAARAVQSGTACRSGMMLWRLRRRCTCPAAWRTSSTCPPATSHKDPRRSTTRRPASEIAARPPAPRLIVRPPPAAALPYAGLTALSAIDTYGGVQSGHKVMVVGAGGGVGALWQACRRQGGIGSGAVALIHHAQAILRCSCSKRGGAMSLPCAAPGMPTGSKLWALTA